MIKNTWRKIGNATTAAAVFSALTLGGLWLTGTFAGGRGASGHAAGHPEAEPEAKEGAHATAEGESHVETATAPDDLHQLEARKCEHEIQQLACEECRYELGVVKVDPSVTRALTPTAKAEQADAVRKLQLTGEVQFDQTALVDVLPPCTGKVVSVQARLGQRVQAGETLAVIRSSEFGEAKTAFMEAQAVAEVAQSERQRQATMSAALDKLLVTLAQEPTVPGNLGEPLGEWKSKLITSAARLVQARAVAKREQSLLDRQASSQAEVETARRELQTADAEYAALVEEVGLNRKLDTLKAENAARLAEARLSAAEQRLHLFGLDDAAIAAISPSRDSEHFAELEIKAPRSGTITAQSVTEGKVLESTQSLCTIADLSSVWVWCNLYERDLGMLHEFMAGGVKPRATVRVPAFAESFAGIVDLVGSVVDETTRTIRVRVQIRNAEGKLRPGMFGTIEVELPSAGKVILVPRQAVLTDEGKSFVFQHWKEDLWLRRDVVVGATRGEQIEIVSGLAPGTTVVARGGFLLKSDILRAKMGAGCAD